MVEGGNAVKRRLGVSIVLTVLTLALGACQLPNPYDPTPYPSKVPPTGSPPQLPAPTEPGQEPESQPAPPSPQQQPPSREYVLSTASKSLVAQAQTQAAGGNYAVAAGSIERAIRIEPSNPLLWIELGKVRQAEGNYPQAESLGRKALSLATGDARAQAAAWRVIAEALRSRGKVQEAREAEATADQLVPR
jgi:tetratricopeptide (TPR) repeat protein